MSNEINFCESCGGRLVSTMIDGMSHLSCSECGRRIFLDPKVAAVVLVSIDRRLVMVKRGVEPALGSWSFPSGFVDRGEAVEDGAIREVKEETGLDVRTEGLIGVYSQTGSPVILVVYHAVVIGGHLNAGHDASEAALFDADDLPPLPFPNDNQILLDWRALGFGQYT